MLQVKYELIDLENSIFAREDFEHEIEIGNDNYYYVLRDGCPHLKVEVDFRKSFDDAVIYNNYLLVGTFDKVYFVNLTDLGVTQTDVEMYFGYFVTTKEAVFVLDGTGIIAFDTNLHEIWRNHSLAIDGVTFQEIVDDEIMIVSCEMDPPEGWIDKKINVKNGKCL